MTGSKVSIFDILNEAHAYYLWPIKASFGRIRLTMTVDPNQHILQHTFNWIVDTHYTPITILHNPVIKGPNEFEKKTNCRQCKKVQPETTSAKSEKKTNVDSFPPINSGKGLDKNFRTNGQHFLTYDHREQQCSISPRQRTETSSLYLQQPKNCNNFRQTVANRHIYSNNSPQYNQHNRLN